MTEKIKVMQVIPNLGLAGAEIMVENLTKGLIDEGIDTSVISLYKEESAITNRLRNYSVPLFYLNKKKGFDFKIYYKLYKLLKREKPTIIHTHRYAMQYTIPVAIMAGIPVKVHTIHNIAEKEVSKPKRILHKLFYKYCKVIPVSISPLVKKSVIKEYNFEFDEVEMIYNGIDLSKCIVKDNYKNDSDLINILHIGRFTKQKNHLGLLESFKMVHELYPYARLTLIGSGELESEIRNKVLELNLSKCVKFLGLQSNVYPHLNNADIFVLPSLWEGMPITLIEAMATGLPIVATNVGGISDMIEDNVSGLLVEPNPQNIADSLMKLVNNYKLRQKLGRAAYLSCRKFSVKMMAKEYIKLYKNTMSDINI